MLHKCINTWAMTCALIVSPLVGPSPRPWVSSGSAPKAHIGDEIKKAVSDAARTLREVTATVKEAAVGPATIGTGLESIGNNLSALEQLGESVRVASENAKAAAGELAEGMRGLDPLGMQMLITLYVDELQKTGDLQAALDVALGALAEVEPSERKYYQVRFNHDSEGDLAFSMYLDSVDSKPILQTVARTLVMDITAEHLMAVRAGGGFHELVFGIDKPSPYIFRCELWRYKVDGTLESNALYRRDVPGDGEIGPLPIFSPYDYSVERITPWAPQALRIMSQGTLVAEIVIAGEAGGKCVIDLDRSGADGEVMFLLDEQFMANNGLRGGQYVITASVTPKTNVNMFRVDLVGIEPDGSYALRNQITGRDRADTYSLDGSMKVKL